MHDLPTDPTDPRLLSSSIAGLGVSDLMIADFDPVSPPPPPEEASDVDA